MSLVTEQCAHGAHALPDADITALLPEVPGWSVHGARLCREFGFDDYDETIAFVNALAWMIKHQDHHPELTVTYRACAVAYDTHSAGGITRNDFICAARANALYDQRCGA